MERRPLGKDTGLSVPVIGLGTYRVFNARTDAGRARCEVVVDAALEQGANFFDSSPMYGEAESVLAHALGDRRDEAIIATKVWARTRAIGEQQIDNALAMFEQVDVYQVHNLLAVADHLPYLEFLQQAGRIGAVGITHYLPSAMPQIAELIRQERVHAVQVPYHPGERTIERSVLPQAEAAGTGVIVMTPLEAGRLMDRPASPQEMVPLAGFGVFTWAQALLKWILSDPRISCVIPATSSADHMRENAAAGRPPWFDENTRDYVAQLATRVSRA